MQDLKREMESQIIRIRKNGLKINHMNGRQHILMLPCLFKPVLSLAKQYQIPFLRISSEIVRVSSLQSRKGVAFFILGILSKYWKLRLIREDSPVKTATYFHGLSFSERMSLKDMMEVLKSLKPGITEIQCHPGYWDENFLPAYCQGRFMREQELKVLKSREVMNYIAKNNIRLTGYGKLALKTPPTT